MKRPLFKLLLFCSPFLIAIGVELFILPIDFFTFRALEALVIRKFDNVLPGQFYPNRTVIKEEEGDLGHHSEYGFKKIVEWTTDSYGYRKKESNRPKYNVVIIGQSETFGAGLTQKEMFSEVLESRLKVGVYPLAPATINAFLKEKRFILDPPETVILTSMTRGMFFLPPPKMSLINKNTSNGTVQNIIDKIEENRAVRSVFVLLDRVYKMNMFRYLRASLGRMLTEHHLRASIGRMLNERRKTIFFRAETKFGPLLFLEGPKANDPVPEEKLDQVARTIQSYDTLFKSRGIRFIFVPIPEKENIFYDFLGTPMPDFLDRLVARLKQSGVETVDVPRAFEDEYRGHSTILYFSDDTHWNQRGVQLAAGLTVRTINNREKRSSSIR